jgi:hypothetical protein
MSEAEQELSSRDGFSREKETNSSQSDRSAQSQTVVSGSGGDRPGVKVYVQVSTTRLFALSPRTWLDGHGDEQISSWWQCACYIERRQTGWAVLGWISAFSYAVHAVFRERRVCERRSGSTREGLGGGLGHTYWCTGSAWVSHFRSPSPSQID